MTNQIVVEKKTVYGNDLLYPLNYQQELFTLTGQKTLSQRHIKALRGMGFEFFMASDSQLINQ
jgi:hypothetical protein